MDSFQTFLFMTYRLRMVEHKRINMENGLTFDEAFPIIILTEDVGIRRRRSSGEERLESGI